MLILLGVTGVLLGAAGIVAGIMSEMENDRLCGNIARLNDEVSRLNAELRAAGKKFGAERKEYERETSALRDFIERMAPGPPSAPGRDFAPPLDRVETGASECHDKSVPESVKTESYPEPEVAEVSGSMLDALPPASDLPAVDCAAVTMGWTEPRYRRGCAVVVPPCEFGSSAPPVFVIGDIHGDAVSFRRILAYVFSVSDDARIVFLGDVADRSPGKDALECARLLFWAAAKRPGRILWIRGNHDTLAWNGERRMFVSGSSPHEFADFLNERPEFTAEGMALASHMRSLPVAAVLGNVFASHGGCLQDDEPGLRSFVGLAGLTDAQCSDLTWSRVRDVPSKLASRVSRGAEVGFSQMKAFAERLSATDGVEIRHFVCGHQHDARCGFGYLPFAKNFAGEITCQCVTSFFNRDAFGMSARPVVLRLNDGLTPVPVFFPSAD